MLRPAFLALALAAAAPSAAQVATLPPADEAAADPSYLTFRSRLLAAAARHDTTAVLRAFAPTATVSFGAEASGAAGVREVWLGPDGPGAAAFFAELAGTLGLGSAVDGELVAAPSMFLRFPPEVDVFGHVIVTGESVLVRDAPSLSGAVLGSVSYAVLPVDAGRGYTDGWVPVRLATEERGWISARYVREPLGYRVGMEKGPRGWQITFFVAGD